MMRMMRLEIAGATYIAFIRGIVMNRLLLGVTLLAAFVAGTAAPCQAQTGYVQQNQFTPTYQQPLSPYLNQLRGKNAAVNYFFGVQPLTIGNQVNQRAGYADAAFLRQRNLEGPDDSLPELPETGHAVRFLNYGSFYNLGGTGQRSGLLSPYQQPRKR